MSVCERLYGPDASTVSSPLFDYSHDAGVLPGDQCPYEAGSAISGNAIYAGSDFPAEYDGALFFADSVRGCVYVMKADEDGLPDPGTLSVFGVGQAGLYPGVDIEVGPDGDLYYSQMLGPESGLGSIHRISFDPGAPTARLKADKLWGPEEPSLKVHFDASESSDPDGEALTYEWDFNGDGTFTVGSAKESRSYTKAENRTVAVRVKDPKGLTSVDQVTIYPGDEPPTPEILTPEESESEPGVAKLEWKVGQTIDFEGRAKDAEGNDIRYTHLYWNSHIAHCPFGPTSCHQHPLQVFPAVESGSLLAPDHDYPSHIELTLTATDSRGLAASKVLELDPRTVQLTLRSNPAAIPLTLGLLSGPSPFTLQAIEGSHVLLSAPAMTQTAGEEYAWESWSDGGARIHTVLADQSRTITANYARSPIKAPPDSNSAAKTPTAARVGIRSHPPKRTHSGTARFTFSSSQEGVSFTCKLDKGAYKACRSPQVYKKLKPGSHSFAVVAIAVGVRGKPAKFSWKVLKPKGR
jgi:PKD repeat protein